MSIVPWEEPEEPVEDCTTTPTTIYDPDGTPVAWLNYTGAALIEELLDGPVFAGAANGYARAPIPAAAWGDDRLADDLRRAWDRLVDAHFTEAFSGS